MALPTPERGLCISYGYLWLSEHEQGREEGVKNRPCVIVLTVEEKDDKQTVTVVPVTHSMPSDPTAGVEIPLPTKQRLGLDEARSWVMVSEGNRFEWPGPDLRPIEGGGRFDIGFCPPALFAKIQAQFRAYWALRQPVIVPRSR